MGDDKRFSYSHKSVQFMLYLSDCRMWKITAAVQGLLFLVASRFPTHPEPKQFQFHHKNCGKIKTSGKKSKEYRSYQDQLQVFSNPPSPSMASLQHALLSPSPLCCCSYALLDPRPRKISSRFSNGTFTTATPFFRAELSKKSGTLAWRMAGRRRLGIAAGAGKGPFSGDGRRQGSTGRVVGNLAFAALLTYLAVTGQFRWVLDAIVSIWLLTILLPILGLGALIFFAGQNILQSDCPNCGKSFRILKSSLKDGPQLCPYCTQPFSVEGNKFVRESARFSSGRAATNAQVFNEFINRGSKGKPSSGSGTIVDIEAEVKDAE